MRDLPLLKTPEGTILVPQRSGIRGMSVKELQSQGVTFAFARVRDDVRERLRLGGIEAAVGASNFYERVTDGVLAWQEQERRIAASDGRRRQ